MSALEIARAYLARGWHPIPIPFGLKGPGTKKWQNVTITPENVSQHFNGRDQNIGVQLGPKSGGLCDVDLDCPEAIQLAHHFLPKTGAVFGRQSKPSSHHLFQVEDPEPESVIKHVDENGGVLLELRLGAKPGKGVQTMFPGSRHPEGEPVEWVTNGEPELVPFAQLASIVRSLAVAALLLRHWPRQKGSRHELALRVGGFLARAGKSESDIARYVRIVAQEAGDEEAEDRSQAAAAAAPAYARGEPVYGLPALREYLDDKAANAIAKILQYGNPLIRVEAGGLGATATRGEEVLRAAGVQLFQRGGTLVRPVIEEVDAAHGQRTKIARFVRLEATYLRDLLSRWARWEKYSYKRWAATDPPFEIADTILARVGEWSFPVVAGIITTPTMRPDGSLLTQPGYDPGTRLLLVEPSPMPPIPEAPTRENALAALSLLEGLLAEFPLVDDVALSVALSALITPVVRGAFPVAPMHALLAPVAGSGKSYLLDTVSAIAIGQCMPVMAAGRDEEETEKRLGAALLTGQPLISIDNVSGELRGDALCQMIERPVVDVRILGRSERVRIEARGTSLFCTGNNMVLVGDLCRRTLTATLDPQLERPELREFTGNPVADVLADRGAYVAAALTVCRAYAVAGRPSRAKRLASFEGWSDTVRSALIWLGKADPVASMEVARGEDPELSALREMLSVWAEVIGTGWDFRRTLQEVIDVSSEKVSEDGDVLRWPALCTAVESVAARHGQADPRSLGLWARAHKGRVVGELRLVNKPDPKGSSTWWVEHIRGELRPGLRTGRGDRASANGPSRIGQPEGPPAIKLVVWVSRETADAVLVQTAVDRPEVWLPKSQVTVVEREDGASEVTVPGWLARKKGLCEGPQGGAQAEIPF
jgi:Bifunctional DNA primase/polymerase, N-terminal